jgi:hypothetical protein
MYIFTGPMKRLLVKETCQGNHLQLIFPSNGEKISLFNNIGTRLSTKYLAISLLLPSMAAPRAHQSLPPPFENQSTLFSPYLTFYQYPFANLSPTTFSPYSGLGDKNWVFPLQLLSDLEIMLLSKLKVRVKTLTLVHFLPKFIQIDSFFTSTTKDRPLLEQLNTHSCKLPDWV